MRAPTRACASAPNPPKPSSRPPRFRGDGSWRSSGASAEHFRQLEWRGDLQLVVGAVLERLVGPPPQEDRGMTEAIALQVVVLHLADALDAKRLPRKVLAGAPTALRSGHAARFCRRA